MRKYSVLSILGLICLVLLISCDPVAYPPGQLKVESIEPLSPGSTTSIKIIYPNIGGSIVLGWKNQKVEIEEGTDVVSVSGLEITGIKPGFARIIVSATTIIADEEILKGNDEIEYYTEILVEVK